MSDSSDLMALKLGPFISRLAQDNDGVITADHFNAIIPDRCIALTDCDPAKAQQIRSIIQDAWIGIFEESAGSQPVTSAVFTEAMKKCDAEKMTSITNTVAAMYFDLIDTNEDGFIGKDEFAVFYQLLGLDPDTAPEAFNAIDTNQDGKLSREEFIAAGVDFITNDDPNSPFKHLLGVIE